MAEAVSQAWYVPGRRSRSASTTKEGKTLSAKREDDMSGSRKSSATAGLISAASQTAPA